jgi:flagellar basal-body rod protein FlgB
MDLFDPTIIGLQRAMGGAMLRQELLANNLANANTAGFKRSDVDFHAALAQAFAAGSPGSAQVADVQFQPAQDTSSVQADGNNVDVDAEMSKLAQNSLDYQAITSAMATRMKILETAIEGR